MKRTALLFFALASLTTGSSPQAPSDTKLKASAELVLVPVVVQKDGAHVGGLKKSDFTLLQDGQPQNIAVFEEIHTARSSDTTELSPNEFTNQHAVSESPQRMTVIALDLVNTLPMDQAYLKQELKKFLANAARTGEPYALLAITSRGVVVLQDFTTDVHSLDAAVEATKTAPIGRTAPGTMDSVHLNQTPCGLSAGGCGGSKSIAGGLKEMQQWMDLYKFAEGREVFLDRVSQLNTLDSLVQIAQYLSGFRGRKVLIWAGSGFPWTGGMTRVMYGPPAGPASDFSTYNPQFANQSMDANVRALEVLNAANISVYPLDARHGANTSYIVFDPSRSDAPIGNSGFSGEKGRIQNDDQERITTFEQIAAQTGGRPCFNRADLANCFKEFASDSHDYYMLGYYPDKKTKAGWHPLGLKLNQKADLRYRKGFVYSDKPVETDPKAELQLAMLSPLPFTALTFHGRFSVTGDSPEKKLVQFNLAIPPGRIDLDSPNNALNFDVVVVARNTEGKEVAKFAQKISRALRPEQADVVRDQGIRYNGKLELPSGTYGFWIVIRDNVTGKIGSAITTLKIE